MAFVDRLVEHPGRITLTDVSTGVVLGTFDVERAEGEVEAEGTPLNADNLNSEIAEAIADQISGFRVGEIQCGKITFKPTAVKSRTTVNVTFPQEFSKLPNVLIIPLTSAPEIAWASATAITTRGFSAHLYRTNVMNTGAAWIAASPL